MKFRFAGRQMYLGFTIAALVILVDQATKALVRHAVPAYSSRPVLGNFLRVTHIPNPGGIFGLSFGEAFPYDFVSALAIALLLILLLRERRKVNMVSYGLLLGGSLGNLWDRIFHIEITDFVDIGIGESFRGLVFNVADFSIVVGLFVFLSATLVRNRMYMRRITRQRTG